MSVGQDYSTAVRYHVTGVDRYHRAPQSDDIILSDRAIFIWDTGPALTDFGG